MSIEATADALAPETAAPIVELSEDEALDAAWERGMAGDPEPERPEPEPKPEAQAAEDGAPEAEEGDEGQAEAEVIPSIIPKAVRDHWQAIPKEARDAIAASQQDISSRLAEGQRLVNGLKPIQDTLIRAAQEMPHLADMKPADIAKDIMALAKVSRDFNEKPVETMLGLIQKHNLAEAVQKALSGQEITPQDRQAPALMKEIEGLKAQLTRISDPEYMRSQFTAITSQERAFESVTKFASTADNWAELEPHIPSLIPIIRGKLGESASAEDVLSEAYRVARTIYLPETKAPEAASVEDAAKDPKRTEAALKAKSVNVTGKPTGRTRDLTEDELLDAAWERAQAR